MRGRTTLVDTLSVSVTSGRTWRYLVACNSYNDNEADAISFDVENLRAGDETIDYYYNTSWQVVEERKNGSSDPLAQYVWDIRYIDAPVLRWRDDNLDGDFLDSNETLYYTQDANFNVTALVNTSGTVLERTMYDPYGKPTFYDANWANPSDSSDYANEILFAGYRYDSETGLYHVRHRAHHPTLGRWMQRDPIGYGDGMDLYEYLSASPVNLTDPSGLAPNRNDAIGFGELVGLVDKWEKGSLYGRGQTGWGLMSDMCFPCYKLADFLMAIKSNWPFGNLTYSFYPYVGIGASSAPDLAPEYKSTSGELSKERVERSRIGWFYLYTRAKRWIDLGHFAQHALNACLFRMGGASDKDALLSTMRTGKGFEELQSWMGRLPSVFPLYETSSAWTEEDVPSNEVGGRFGNFWIDRAAGRMYFVTAFQAFLLRYGPLQDPRQAPGYRDLPESQREYEETILNMPHAEFRTQVEARRERERRKYNDLVRGIKAE